MIYHIQIKRPDSPRQSVSLLGQFQHESRRQLHELLHVIERKARYINSVSRRVDMASIRVCESRLDCKCGRNAYPSPGRVIRARVSTLGGDAWDVAVLSDEAVDPPSQFWIYEVLNDTDPFAGAGLDVCGHVHLEHTSDAIFISSSIARQIV